MVLTQICVIASKQARKLNTSRFIFLGSRLQLFSQCRIMKKELELDRLLNKKWWLVLLHFNLLQIFSTYFFIDSSKIVGIWAPSSIFTSTVLSSTFITQRPCSSVQDQWLIRKRLSFEYSLLIMRLILGNIWLTQCRFIKNQMSQKGPYVIQKDLINRNYSMF